jgi:hypothetical protein
MDQYLPLSDPMPERSDDQAAAQHDDLTLPGAFLFRIETKQEGAIEPVTKALALEAREPRGTSENLDAFHPAMVDRKTREYLVGVVSPKSNRGCF